MMDEHEYALGELDRRMGNLMRFGTVSAVDSANALVKVDIGDLVTDWIPWTVASAGQNRAWRAPDVGEQVVMVSPGDPSQGVVLGSVYQNAHPANGNNGKDWRLTFKDGSVAEFDRDGSNLAVTVNPAGSIKLTIGSTVLELKDGEAILTAEQTTVNASTSVVVNSPQSTFNGAVTVTGLLTYGGGLSGSGGSGASLTGPLNVTGNVTTTGTLQNNGKNVGSTHTHSGVQSGGGSTGAPN